MNECITRALAVLLLTACASGESTVRLTVLYDDGSAPSALDIVVGERVTRVGASHEVLVFPDDDWVGEAITIDVFGVHDGASVSFGRAVVTPLPAAEVNATVLLMRLACEGTTCASRVACPALAEPANGSVDRTIGAAGDVATYACEEGFALVGNGGANTRTCDASGLWSGSAPSCEAQISPCEPSPCVNGGACELEGEGSFRCACAPGFTGATCAMRVSCPTLSAPLHGSVERASGAVGDVASYSCESGYTLVGYEGFPTRTCEETGQWSGIAPSCAATNGYPVWPLPGTAGHPRSYDVREHTVLDWVTHLEWQRVTPEARYVRASAITYCADLVLDGKSDWRLPTRIELMSIVDYERAAPLVDPAVFPWTAAEDHWSSSTLASDPTQAWFVGFRDGVVGTESVEFALAARCVRGARVHVPPPGGRFTIGTTTVRDNYTGLVWADGESMVYPLPSAELYCDLEHGGRVPTALELASLVDETSTEPAIDLEAFFAVRGPLWSSTRGGSGGYALQIWFEQGTVGPAPDWAAVKCVR
jgi:hypothetical protein